VKPGAVSLDVDQTVVSAVRETFESMFAVPVEDVKVVVSPENQLSFDVGGLVGFQQRHARGLIGIYSDAETMGPVLEKIYNKPITKADAELVDGVGEIANIVYGMVKSQLSAQSIDLPLVVPQPALEFSALKGDSGSRLWRFKIPFGSIFVHIEMVIEKGPASAQNETPWQDKKAA
jgi:CheY-specific phosphatase CheX